MTTFQDTMRRDGAIAADFLEQCARATLIVIDPLCRMLTCRKHGIDVRHDMFGFYLLTDDEADHEDKGHNSVGFDGRSHWNSIEEALAAGERRIREGFGDVTA